MKDRWNFDARIIDEDLNTNTPRKKKKEKKLDWLKAYEFSPRQPSWFKLVPKLSGKTRGF